MLTTAWEPLRPHAKQSELWRTRARFVAVRAGRGSGKTELARRRIVRFLSVKKKWPDPVYAYALPTQPQAKKVAWRKLKALIPVDWIDDINETELRIETKFGSTLYALGMDRPARAEGIQYDGIVIDESSDQKPGTFDRTFLPALAHRSAWAWRIGVPKRAGVGAVDFNDFYDRCEKDTTGQMAAFSWPSWDIVPQEEIDFARENLDEKDFLEQYGAEIQAMGGLIFHAYSDVTNVRDIEYNPELPLIIGSDFNVSPMAWIIAQRVNNTLHVLDELFIRNTSTQEALNRLWKKFETHTGGFCFYGDATGRARKTAANSAAQSDYAILANDKRFYLDGMPKVFYPRSNPQVVDRFAACNALFKNAAGDIRCFIHPRCKNLRKDLLVRAYVEGTREADDSGDIGHITDALGYVVHAIWPVTRERIQEPEIHIG